MLFYEGLSFRTDGEVGDHDVAIFREEKLREAVIDACAKLATLFGCSSEGLLTRAGSCDQSGLPVNRKGHRTGESSHAGVTEGRRDECTYTIAHLDARESI